MLAQSLSHHPPYRLSTFPLPISLMISLHQFGLNFSRKYSFASLVKIVPRLLSRLSASLPRISLAAAAINFSPPVENSGCLTSLPLPRPCEVVEPAGSLIDDLFRNLNMPDLFRYVILPLATIPITIYSLKYLVEGLNPTAKEKTQNRKQAYQILHRLGITSPPKMTDYEVCIAISLVDSKALSITWAEIGGLSALIQEIRDSVIHPFLISDLLPLQSRIFRSPKGVLLFGPPGCGKTMIAQAMAREAKAIFINLQISSLVNMWYGETQKLVEAVFTLANKLQPSIVFIDEIDSFLTTRSSKDNESTRMMKTQFMALWDGILTNRSSRILFIGATNRPGDLDDAILRRLSYRAYIPLPDADQRKQILSLVLSEENVFLDFDDSELKLFASTPTEGLSGSDLVEVCRQAALERLKEELKGQTGLQ